MLCAPCKNIRSHYSANIRSQDPLKKHEQRERERGGIDGQQIGTHIVIFMSKLSLRRTHPTRNTHREWVHHHDRCRRKSVWSSFQPLPWSTVRTSDETCTQLCTQVSRNQSYVHSKYSAFLCLPFVMTAQKTQIQLGCHRKQDHLSYFPLTDTRRSTIRTQPRSTEMRPPGVHRPT